MLTKKLLPNGRVRVTFTLTSEHLDNDEAESVYLVGDFNYWDETATPMQRTKNGDWQVTLELAPEREYQFRYLVNGNRWQNEWHADRFVANPFSGDNSIVSTHLVLIEK